MNFGNLNNVLENEQTIMEAVKQNYYESIANIKKPTRFSKILTSLSHYGMDYDDKIFKNMMAIPADKFLQPKDDTVLQQNLFGK